MTHLESGILQIVTTTRSQGKPLDFKWISRKIPPQNCSTHHKSDHEAEKG
jgi:hypothetical protein